MSTSKNRSAEPVAISVRVPWDWFAHEEKHIAAMLDELLPLVGMVEDNPLVTDGFKTEPLRRYVYFVFSNIPKRIFAMTKNPEFWSSLKDAFDLTYNQRCDDVLRLYPDHVLTCAYIFENDPIVLAAYLFRIRKKEKRTEDEMRFIDFAAAKLGISEFDIV